MGERAVTLDEWEVGRLRIYAAGNALTFVGHYVGAGLSRSEVATMNAWRRLAAKLEGDPPPEDLPYRGTRRNGFNPNAD